MEDFWETVKQAVGEAKYKYSVNAYNIFKSQDAEKRDLVFKGLGFNKESMRAISYPALVVNGKAYFGQEEIAKSFKEAYLTAGEDLFENKRGVVEPLKGQFVKDMLEGYPTAEKNSSAVVYFYRSVCEECIKTRDKLMRNLPVTVKIEGESVKNQVISINSRSGNNGDLLKVFFEKYKVPAEEQMVPIVFTAKGYLAGYDNISDKLQEQILTGDGLYFIMPE